jgi:ribosomal protein S18 acetylase RimI-like enzyme
MSKLPAVLGKDAFVRFGTALDYLTRVHGPSTPPRAWYLAIVGVAPARRRRGIGAALLAPILARADAEQLPCCLDTSQPDNRSFYEGLGFRVTADTVDPASGVRFWTFQRDPR